MKYINLAINKVVSGTGLFSAVLLFLLGIFVFCNSLSRFLGFSLPWLFDVTTFSMVIMAFIGAAYALREKVHVSVDIIKSLLSKETKKLLDIFIYLVMICFFVLLGWKGFNWASNNLAHGVVSTTSTLKLPMGVLTMVIPVGCLLLIIQALKDLVKTITEIKELSIPPKKFLTFCLIMILLILVGIFSVLYLHPIAAMFILLLIVLFCGVPIAFSLGIVGVVGLYLLYGNMQLLQVPMIMFNSLNSWSLTSAPLFILGGMLMSEGKAAERLFSFIETLFVRLPCPLLLATIISGAFFCAITGSSVAAHAAIGTICLPLLFARGYYKPLAVGVVAGATVGTLIPPSNAFILYGCLTEVSIGKLFMAGIGPAVVLFSFYIIYAIVRSYFLKGKPQDEAMSFTAKERLARLKSGFWGMLAPVIILGGIYFGAFTPTEAGGILVVYALISGLISKTMGWKQIWNAIHSSLGLSLMILLIMAGASIYGKVISQSQFINVLLNFVQSINMTAPIYLIIVLVIILILGMFMEGVSITMIMVPLTFPIAMALGIDPLWFAVFYVIGTEIGLLTPPVGLNLFVIQGITKMPQTFVIRSTVPFLCMLVLTLIVCYFFPGIVTWLPNSMY